MKHKKTWMKPNTSAGPLVAAGLAALESRGKTSLKAGAVTGRIKYLPLSQNTLLEERI